MKAFVTGANGFVGRYLCNHIETLGSRVTRASRRSLPGHVPIDHAFVTVEQQAKAIGLSDVVFHLAGRAHRQSGEDPDLFHRDNVEATKRVFEAALRAEVRQFVFVSTLRVLGESSERPFAPSDERNPADAYSRSKAEAEEWLTDQHGRGMAISTIIILMLINGFTVCELLGQPASGLVHRTPAQAGGPPRRAVPPRPARRAAAPTIGAPPTS